MAVDDTSLERIRNATFPSERRGYDKREVEKFLHRLADWLETGGGDAARSDTVRRELERVGQRTGSILAHAEESAQQIRDEAEREVADSLRRARAESDQARKESEAYVNESRIAADAYSEKVRADADAYVANARKIAERHSAEVHSKAEQEARTMIEGAQSQAGRTVEAGIKRRRDIESVISDLTARRDNVIEQIESLNKNLGGAIREHKPSGAGGDPFATPPAFAAEKPEAPKAEPPKAGPPKAEPAKTEPPKAEKPKPEKTPRRRTTASSSEAKNGPARKKASTAKPKR